MSTPTAHARTLVSYDDIISPQTAPAATPQVLQHSPTQAPSKKRKRSAKSNRKHKVNRGDELGRLEESTVYTEESMEEARDPGVEEEEENRELTHEEIWDDSALIDAWNAAAEEYEVCRFISFGCPCTFR
jgi:hypothetical protein